MSSIYCAKGIFYSELQDGRHKRGYQFLRYKDVQERHGAMQHVVKAYCYYSNNFIADSAYGKSRGNLQTYN